MTDIQLPSTLLAVGLDGQLKHKTGVAANAAHDNITSMGSCYGTDDGQAESAAAGIARARRISAEEAVENAIKVLGSDALPVVGDL